MENHAHSQFRNLRADLRAIENSLGQNYWQLLLNGSFGDTYMAFSLLDSFRKNHEGLIRVVFRDRYKSVAETFFVPGIEFFPLTDQQINTIEQHLHANIELIDFRPGRIYPTLPTMHANLPELCTAGRLRYLEVLRAIFRLPVGEPLTPPNYSKEMLAGASQVLKTAGGVPNRSVILNPANNTHKEFSPLFWKKIARKLVESGRPVFTNIAELLYRREGLQPPVIPLTRPIVLPPHLAVATIDAAGTFISGVNGLLSIAALFCRSAKRIQLDYLLEGDPSPTKGAWKCSRFANSHLAQYSPDMIDTKRFCEVAVHDELNDATLTEILQEAALPRP